jgi:SAM-dependent methyltransferase
MIATPLTTTAYWAGREPRRLPKAIAPSWIDIVRPWLPPARARVLEVGAVPCGMLRYFAEAHGYDCTGLDYTADVQPLAAQFEDALLPVRLIEHDFLTWASADAFDLVYSCGFIEHFEDPQPIIARHWDLVRPGGLLILSVPTLTPVQHLLRLACYTRAHYRRILDAHNTAIMGVTALARALDALPGAERLAAAPSGCMTVWFGPGSTGVRSWTGPLFPPLRAIERTIASRRWSHTWFSPEAVAVARKRHG